MMASDAQITNKYQAVYAAKVLSGRNGLGET